MKKLTKTGGVIEAQPLGMSPEEFSDLIRDRWLPSIQRGSHGFHTRGYSLIPFLEAEAIEALHDMWPELPRRPIVDKRPQVMPAPSKGRFKRLHPPALHDTYEDAHERWRSLWAREAQAHEAHVYGYPRRHAAAIRILVAASQLRAAVESDETEKASALAMLIAFEAIGGGYGLALEADAEAKQALANARATAFKKGAGQRLPDLKRAEDACVRLAASIWENDQSTRIGDVVDQCIDHLYSTFNNYPTLDNVPAKDTIKGWLKTASKGSRLCIPPEAQRPGANKKK